MRPPSVKNTNGSTTLPQIVPHAPIDTLPLLKDGLRFFSRYSSPGLHVTQIFLLSLPTSKVTSSVQITFFQSLSNQFLCSLHHSRLDRFCIGVIYDFFLAFLQFIPVFLRIFRTVGQLICLPTKVYHREVGYTWEVGHGIFRAVPGGLRHLLSPLNPIPLMPNLCKQYGSRGKNPSSTPEPGKWPIQNPSRSS